MEKKYYNGGIYLRKTVNDLKEENVDFPTFIHDIVHSEEDFFGINMYEKFFLLHYDENKNIYMFSPSKYKGESKSIKLENTNEIDEKYMFLYDFLNKANYVGKTFGIMDEKNKEFIKRSGKAYYECNDRVLIGITNPMTEEEEFYLLKERPFEKHIFHGLADEKYVDKKKMYADISKQIIKSLDNDNLGKDKTK